MKSWSIVLINVGRTILIYRNFMCLSLLYSNPSSSTILINYLYLSLVSIVSVFLSDEESYLSGKLNTTTLFSISLNNEIKSDILYLVLVFTYLNFTQILRVIFKLSIIQLFKFCLIRIYSQNKYRSYTCISLYCIAFFTLCSFTKCHKSISNFSLIHVIHYFYISTYNQMLDAQDILYQNDNPWQILYNKQR